MITVIGEALVDLVLGDGSGAGDAGAVVAALGGAPFNVARTCGRLGADVAFVGAISEDRFGGSLAARLREDAVDLGSVQYVPLPTTLALAELDARGSARYRFYLAGTSAPSLQVDTLDPATDVLVTGGLGLVLEPMATTITGLVTRAGDRVLVVVDVNCRPAVIDDVDRYHRTVESVVRRADVVKVSDEDVGYLFPDAEPAEAAELLLARGPRAVLLTAGASGVTILTSDGRRHVPAPAVDVVDTIGAGDAFTGGFVSWWTTHGLGRAELADLDALGRAAGAAAAVAGVVCTRRGADPPRRDELAPGTW